MNTRLKIMNKQISKELEKEIEKIIKELNLNCSIDVFKTTKNIDWDWISKYQKLSEDFKSEFKHRLNSK